MHTQPYDTLLTRVTYISMITQKRQHTAVYCTSVSIATNTARLEEVKEVLINIQDFLVFVVVMLRLNYR